MKRALVIFIVGVVFFGACSAQSANIEQRIIGTWVDQQGNVWIFNDDGTLTVDTDEVKFVVTDTQMAYTRNSSSVTIFNISMSSDGKTLLIMTGGTGGFWLTKQ